MRRLVFAYIAMVIVSVSPIQSSKAAQCGSHDQIHGYLEKKYNEQIFERGITTQGNLILIYRSSDLSTFTILSVSPTGTACVVASGTDWSIYDRFYGDPA